MKWKTVILLSAFALLFLFTCRNNTASDGSAARQEPPTLTAEEQEAFLEKGTDITTATFNVLSGQLKSALQEKGVAGAIKYCNLAAYPLVDSLSRLHNASIRRTSLKARNPGDKPTAKEQAVLDAYHASEKAGEALLPKVLPVDASTVAYYAPIQVQEPCLKCHGKLGESLKAEDYATILELYPYDEAIGYAAGDLRGIWSVTFRR